MSRPFSLRTRLDTLLVMLMVIYTPFRDVSLGNVILSRVPFLSFGISVHMLGVFLPVVIFHGPMVGVLVTLLLVAFP